MLSSVENSQFFSHQLTLDLIRCLDDMTPAQIQKSLIELHEQQLIEIKFNEKEGEILDEEKDADAAADNLKD